ncbi:hypothetical protein I4U23_004378 [Adineta vaga]|nr:hypothetical protein I4U23_004378 [Adineta vaga]
MSGATEVEQLKPCVVKIMELVKECLDKVKSTTTTDDKHFQNSLLNNNIYTFTLNNEEINLLDKLTYDIQTAIIHFLPHLSSNCISYLFDFLHTYHYDSKQKKFISSLSIDFLHSFLYELKGLLSAPLAFTAAFDGRIDIVKSFLKEYPTYKDKSGLWETTLLYSAARNNHFDLVRYLIEEAYCSVNAQNQCDVDFALATGNPQTYKPRPTAGSTALHGACFNKHLTVVKYLTEHGADYFIRNQALETPIQNGEQKPEIKKFFQDYLILSYTDQPPPAILPDRPILDDEQRPLCNCMWEYKPFQDPKWYKFTYAEAMELHKVLLPSKEFQPQVYLNPSKGLYSVSMVEFLRSGRHQDDPQKNMAWIRCRGSSILNFDCFAIWQLMLIQHEQVDKDTKTFPSLKISQFPNMFNSRFKLQLNTWYQCDSKTSSLIENSMNYRRKISSIDIPYVGNDLKLNLQTFEISNEKKSISGYLRWIPQLISANETNHQKIVYVDNYQLNASIQPTPLTTKRLKEVSQTDNSKNQDENNENSLDILIPTFGTGNDDEDDDDIMEASNIKISTTSKSFDTWSVNDLTEEIAANSFHLGPRKNSTQIREDSEVSFDDYFNEKVGNVSQLTFVERINSSQKDQLIIDSIAKLQSQMQDPKFKTEVEHLFKEMKTIDYDNIEMILVKNFLFINLRYIISYLKAKHPIFKSSLDIPNIIITEKTNVYCISFTGLNVHHDEFKRILRQMKFLLNLIQSAKTYYQQQLNNTYESINHIITKQIYPSSDWISYTKSYQDLLKMKINEFLHSFDEYLLKESKSIFEQMITEPSFQAWVQLQKLTDRYLKKKQLKPELQIIKHEALDQFIKQHVLSERSKFETKPTTKSLQTMVEFIDKTKKQFQTNPLYNGCDLEQFRYIPIILQRIIIYYRCFLLQLPLYESSKDLLDKIEKNTVITIATASGLGKSSLLPPLLIAEGYDKVIVTQPRRLLCTSICNRVNETMTINKDQMKLAGWAANSVEYNVKGRVLYLTDSLLKERLLYDENFLTNELEVSKLIVFILDEIHEQSINIDLCLALMIRLLTEKPQIQSKIKVIVSSSTLDSSIPKLILQFPQIKFDEFQLPTLGSIYPITKFARPNENILDLVQELCKKRERDEQILCFVSNILEVYQYCRLLEEISRGTMRAFPLIPSQSVHDQQLNIKRGNIFFATHIAETSLTFPSLTYVIDTGMVDIPIYDLDKKQTITRKIQISQSIIKQRIGRLGRTRPGEYYSLYEFKVDQNKYPRAQIQQIELVYLEFLIRKSSIKQGLSYLNKFLPNPLNPQAITGAIDELKRLNLLDSQEKFTTIGIAISKLPNFGSISMSKSVLSALNENKCGRDLIVLSSILNVLSTSAILKSIPNSMKRPEGDFMTLLNVLNEILLIKESVRAEQFQLAKVCEAKNLMSILHILKQALKRYENLEKSFNLSDEYREKAHVTSNNWKSIAKSLLHGYEDHVFICMKELCGRTHLFTRYYSLKTDVAILDSHSTFSSTPASLIIARDISYSSALEEKAILSFVGEIKSNWIEYQLTRELRLETKEEEFLTKNNILANVQQIFPNVRIRLNNHILNLEGLASVVLNAELDLLRQLISEDRCKFVNFFKTNEKADYERMQRNLESVSKMPQIFSSMIQRWQDQYQMKITVNNNSFTTECEIIIEGRLSKIGPVKSECRSFNGWLKECAVIRHPNAGVPPRILKPQMRHNCLDIEEKISRVTDSKRTSMELWKSLTGSKATRESRMEVVAWIAVCQFDCRLEGGFVRDWIVGNHTGRPSGDPLSWIIYDKNKSNPPIPEMNKALIPSDLDCHLPLHKYFDIDLFCHYLRKYEIDCKVYRGNWRYVLLIDANRKSGAFTMDLIEPHVALTHDRIDFDVGDLSLEKDYTKELGMRVDIQNKPYSIELETIVDNIKNKRFQILRPIDDLIKERIDKMKSRGWTQRGQPLSVIPDPPQKYNAVLVPLPESTALYKSLVQQMTSSISKSVQVISIEQIRNPLVEDAYISMKQLIQKQRADQNPNERELFHGTSGEAIDGILNDGYDNRYWGTKYSKGNWGYGAYFAENPLLSHAFTSPDPTDQTRVMYYNKVLLGNEWILEKVDKDLMSTPKGYHSTHGKFPGQPDSDEFIVYCYGQALPHLKILYKA